MGRQAGPLPNLIRPWSLKLARDLWEYLRRTKDAVAILMATPATPTSVEAGTAASGGTGDTPARDNHQHDLDETGSVQSVGLANAAGSGPGVARKTHVHADAMTTNGDLVTVTGGARARLAVGAEDTVLAVVSGLPAWASLGSLGLPKWTKYTVAHTALQAAATTNDVELFSLAAQEIIHAVAIKHSEAFAGGSISAYTVSVGIAGEADRYADAYDVFQAVAATTFDVNGPGLSLENFGAATSVRVFAVATGDDLDQSTAGSVDIWVLASTLP